MPISASAASISQPCTVWSIGIVKTWKPTSCPKTGSTAPHGDEFMNFRKSSQRSLNPFAKLNAATKHTIAIV